MLSIFHPEVMPAVHDLRDGLMAFRVAQGGRLKLVVKAPKEAILAAKLDLGFKVFVVPLPVIGERCVGLIAAFYDNPDEPLIISILLSQGTSSEALRALLLSKDFDVHLFNENNQEFLAYKSTVVAPASTVDLLGKAFLFDPDSVEVFRKLPSAMDSLVDWFSARTSDADALCVMFLSPLYADNIAFMDLRPESHLHKGNNGLSLNMLDRPEPGAYQEQEIIQLLRRSFSPGQIYANPRKPGDEKEIADVMVVTDSTILLIQAKDRRNVEEALRAPIEKKKRAALRSLQNAANQVRGACRYVRRSDNLSILVDGEVVEIPLEGRALRALVVVQELFSDGYSEYSPVLFELADDIESPVVAFDFSQLNCFTAARRGEVDFFAGMDDIYRFARSKGVFPLVRFW